MSLVPILHREMKDPSSSAAQHATSPSRGQVESQTDFSTVPAVSRLPGDGFLMTDRGLMAPAQHRCKLQALPNPSRECRPACCNIFQRRADQSLTLTPIPGYALSAGRSRYHGSADYAYAGRPWDWEERYYAAATGCSQDTPFVTAIVTGREQTDMV